MYVDNDKVPKHVGDHTRREVSPVEKSGWVLYPLIRMAILLLRELKTLGKYVLLKHLAREYNLCDMPAKDCMRTARDNNWEHPQGSAPQTIAGNPDLMEARNEVSRNQRKLNVGGFSSSMYKNQWLP